MVIGLYDKKLSNQDKVLDLPGFEGAGNIIHDISKYHNNGIITGPTWTQLPSGQWYLDFDGDDDEIDCGNNAILDFTSESFTVEFWAKFTSAPGDNGYVLNRGTYQVNGWYIWFFNASNQLQFYTNWAGSGVAATSMAMEFDVWLHLRVVRAGTSVTWYKNEVDVTIDAGSHTDPVSVNTPLKIGAIPNDDYKGGLALIRIYDVATQSGHYYQEKDLFGV